MESEIARKFNNEILLGRLSLDVYYKKPKARKPRVGQNQGILNSRGKIYDL
jgi:hypothetical protein